MTDNLDNLRSIEGFPKGKDEDLLALSNPPYYTAYPNPHIEDFIRQYGKPYDEDTDDYQKEPFVTDVSEGKNEPIYNAHSYHTKVPYKAITPFIEHYTKPGDVVFDGFCGTGMVGVAAQSVGRRAIVSDLSTAAAFIAYNYNTPVSTPAFIKNLDQILEEAEKEIGWLYETIHTDGRKGKINYTVWSDVFTCPYCKSEMTYWKIAIKDGEIRDSFLCPHCKATLTKRELVRSLETVEDKILATNITRTKQVPVLINYFVGTKRFEKIPDERDLLLIEKINKLEIPYWFPTTELFNGDKLGEPIRLGITHAHHFYTKRNLWALSCLFKKLEKSDPRYIVLALSIATGLSSKLCRYNLGHRGNGLMSGTIYIPSLIAEANVTLSAKGKVKDITQMSSKSRTGYCRVSNQSVTDIKNIPASSIDYIFTDPPFGSNLMYSELNFLWEVWLKVLTNNGSEAIMNSTQKKDLDDYRALMTRAFSEMYRILKPGRWITIEFHNSKASVWNAIQESLAKAGFLVAQVTVIDKQQGSFNQVSAAGAVKNDLVINAYKPRATFELNFMLSAGKGLEAEFIREHLKQLPIAQNIERSKEMLYSKYLAYYIQRGYQVMYNGEQFYSALSHWGLEERDGYWFTDEAQANEYEKRKVRTFGKGGIQAQAVLFVSDERSARQWIWNYLDQPKSYDEIYTDFLKALQTSEDEIPEVKTILEESFVRTNGHWKRPDQLTQAELEKKRQERLLRQFEEYLSTAKANQKLKEVRLEAVIAGFTECYRSGRYKDILLVGKKLDKGILENSSDLYDFIDIAEAKVEG